VPETTSPHVVDVIDDAPLVAISDRYALPERFSATIVPADPAAPLCHIPIAEYTRRVADQCGHWIIPGHGPVTITTADGETHPMPWAPFGDAHFTTPFGGVGLTADYRTAVRPLRERGRITDETLERVARIYKEANRAPTKAVRDTLPCSASTASRLVRRAKQAGLIPE
jgi:hypothetical protein